MPRKLRAGGPDAQRLRKAFARSAGARCYLSHVRTRIVPGGGGERDDALLVLIEEANDYIMLGQFTAIADAWDRLRTTGVLDTLQRTDRAVLQGLFMLAMLNGPQVIAARGYVRDLIEEKFGVKVTDRTVSNVYQRLHRRQLLEVLPGRPGRGRDASTRIELRSLLQPASGSPSAEAQVDLTMKPSTRTALEVYRVSAYARRAALAASLGGSPGALRPLPRAGGGSSTPCSQVGSGGASDLKPEDLAAVASSIGLYRVVREPGRAAKRGPEAGAATPGRCNGCSRRTGPGVEDMPEIELVSEWKPARDRAEEPGRRSGPGG
jgi:hypothetical protein